MTGRRGFLKASLCGGVSLLRLPSFATTSGAADNNELPYHLSRHTPTRLYDGKRCWCHPRAGIVPNAGLNGLPRVVITMNTLDVAGSDVFKGVFGLRTDDLGKTWTEARELVDHRTNTPVGICVMIAELVCIPRISGPTARPVQS